jgi:starch phosphorylase
LNTPERPLEASGTSGMKAAVNGVPSLSILDGWWIEGHIEGVTGWSIGERQSAPSNAAGEAEADGDAENLYQKLEKVILPLYYGDRAGYVEVMRHAVALNASFFNTERMVSEYARQAYRLAGEL